MDDPRRRDNSASGYWMPPVLSVIFSLASLACALITLVLVFIARDYWWKIERYQLPIYRTGAALTVLFTCLGFIRVSRRSVLATAAAVLGPLLVLSALLLPEIPVWQREGERPWRSFCSNNLKQIGLALLMYANDHTGRLPAGWTDLAETQDLDANVFICSYTDDSPARGALKEVRAALSKGAPHCSYVYLGRGVTLSTSPDLVLGYEVASNHDGDGMNVLFADGHVEWLIPSELQPALDARAAGKPAILLRKSISPPATAPVTSPVRR